MEFECRLGLFVSLPLKKKNALLSSSTIDKRTFKHEKKIIRTNNVVMAENVSIASMLRNENC